MADHPGGRQDRPLRLRGPGPVLRRPDRPDAADRQRGALLGRRRHRHGDHGHLARASPRSSARAPASRWASGSRSASARPRSPKVAAFCVSEPNAGSDVSSLRTRAQVRRGHGRVGPQRAEGVGDERRHREGPRRRRLGRPPSSAPAARPRSSSRPARRASRWGRRSRSTACAPRTPRTSSSTTAAIPGRQLLGGKEKLDERLARAREGTRARSQAAMATFEASRPTVGAQALGIARAAYEYALEYAERPRAVRARRSSTTRRSRSRWPT